MNLRSEKGAWRNAIARCADMKNRRYGGRGIRVCASWIKSFDRFIEHIGPKQKPYLTLDRIDNNKGYFPGNVRWTTPSQNASNRECRNPNRIPFQTIGVRPKTFAAIRRISKVKGIRLIDVIDMAVGAMITIDGDLRGIKLK